MSDAARAKPVVESCLDDGHERADHQVFVVCITCTTNAYVAEQTAALREDNTRLREKMERAKDEATALCLEFCAPGRHTKRCIALRTALLANPKGQGCKYSPGNAPSQFCPEHGEGQRAGEEWQYLQLCRELVERAVKEHARGIFAPNSGRPSEAWVLWLRHAYDAVGDKALAAVERARQP